MLIICSNSTKVFLNVGLVTVRVKCSIHSMLTLELSDYVVVELEEWKILWAEHDQWIGELTLCQYMRYTV